jgi:phosphate transport system protein
VEHEPPDLARIDQGVSRLFTLVSEALAGATYALLAAEPVTGQLIADADRLIDELTLELDRLAWSRITSTGPSGQELRHLVGVLLILPELERSADLAEHIAQRAVSNLGFEMSPVSRGIVQRMSDVALEMWKAVADAYEDHTAQGIVLDDADEEIDILRDRLTAEVAASGMPTSVSAQVTLLARFYERLGDHAVNLARRIETLLTDAN